MAPLQRRDIVRRAMDGLDVHSRYRMEELELISKQLKSFFGLDFEVDHAEALLNSDNPGSHHPDNLQLLLKVHNGKKHNKNWKRFSFDEQEKYIRTAVELQRVIASRMGIAMTESVLDSLIARLSSVYKI